MRRATKTQAFLLIILFSLQIPAKAGEFAKSLSPENIQSTGLAKLTPGELAALEVLIESYKAGVTKKASDAARPTPARDGVTSPEARIDKKIVPEWVSALITLKRTENSSTKPEPLESRIAGEFRGWTGRSSFKLENGQVWIQLDNASYDYTPPLDSPRVKIRPAAFGTFWLEIEGVNSRCRVRPYKLE